MGKVISMDRPHPLHRATKAEVAAFFCVSENTVGRWIKKGCPVDTVGDLRTPYEIDCREVARWYFSRSATDSGSESAPDELRPTDRRAWFQSENERVKYEKEQRNLIPAAEVEEVIGTTFAAVAHMLRSIPDNLERKRGLSPDIIAIIDDEIVATQHAMADRLSSLGQVTEEEHG